VIGPRTPPRLPGLWLALCFALALSVAGAQAPEAAAFNPLKPVCGVVGWVSGIAGKACGVVQHGDKLLSAGKKLVTGHIGGAAKALAGGASSAASGLGAHAAALVGLAAVGTWVLGGAKTALRDTATVLDKTTRPQLTSTWFSSTYWRMAGIAALLTLPFLFAAAVQALMRSDLAMLARASFGYLPLSLLAVSIAAPLTMLLLAASDQISAAVSSAAGGAGTRFLAQLGVVSGTLSVLSRSPFVAFFVGLLTVSAAVILWVEMLMREAAVYIVVLMLPLAFAALVWPARRVWAVRVVELLVALILSKFAIVAVLALGGAALGQRGSGGAGGMLVGLVLVVLAAAAPWALVRLLPMTELASAAAGQLRGESGRIRGIHGAADAATEGAGDWAGSVTAGMRRQAADAAEPDGDGSARTNEVEKLRSAAQSAVPHGSNAQARDADAELLLLGTAAGAGAGAMAGAAGGVGGAAGGVGGAAGGVGGAADGAGPRGDAATGAPVTPATTAVEQRLPGLAPMYQQENGAWDPIEVGPEAFPAEPLWDRPLGSTSSGAPEVHESPAPNERPGADEAAGDQRGDP
jgi:hypothetical protein